MKRIFLHAGLHKTGTTALQLTLLNNKKKLLDQNICYPGSGIPHKSHGHHNIAWQLSRDRRFRTEYGDIKKLLQEMNDVDSEVTILSSEDFESSLLHPQRFQKIIEYFTTKGVKVNFVIYVRRQADYLQSMYSELLKAGFGDEFNAYAQIIASAKTYKFREWEFLFDYPKIEKSLASLKNVEVIFRNYDALVGGNTVLDFCKVVGIDHEKLEVSDNVDRINKRLATRMLLKLFVRNRVGAKPDGFFDLVDELIGIDNKILTLPINTKNVFERMADQNGALRSSDSSKVVDRNDDAWSAAKVFSFETCNLLLVLMGMNDNPSEKKQVIEEWRRWVKIAP